MAAASAVCSSQLYWIDKCPGLTRVADLQDATKKECGLHSGKVADAGGNGAEARVAERDLWHTDGPVEGLSRQQLSDLADGPRDKNTLVVLYAPWCPFSQVCWPAKGCDRATCVLDPAC